MAPMKSIFMVIPLLAILSIQLPMASATVPGADLIKKTCSKTMYPDICASSLQSDPDGLKSDVQGLAVIAIKLAHDAAVSTSNYISDVLNKTGISPIQLQSFHDCADNYGDAVDLLGDSVGAALDKKYSDVNAWVTAAMSDVDSCEQTSSGALTELSQKNFELSKLCSNALAITKLIVS